MFGLWENIIVEGIDFCVRLFKYVLIFWYFIVGYYLEEMRMCVYVIISIRLIV